MEKTAGGTGRSMVLSERGRESRGPEGTQEKGTFRRQKGLGRDVGGLAEMQKQNHPPPPELSISRGGG